MKAYGAQNDFTGYGTVVFAETRGKATASLLYTDAFEGCDFIEIRPYRIPELDKEYRGHFEMDWFDAKDRIALVKMGWQCDDDSFDSDECAKCPAKDYCNRYEDYLEEEREWENE